jgi:hypothetical protein
MNIPKIIFFLVAAALLIWKGLGLPTGNLKFEWIAAGLLVIGLAIT